MAAWQEADALARQAEATAAAKRRAEEVRREGEAALEAQLSLSCVGLHRAAAAGDLEDVRRLAQEGSTQPPQPTPFGHHCRRQNASPCWSARTPWRSTAAGRGPPA